MTENITQNYMDRIASFKDDARRVIQPEFYNPEATPEQLRGALSRLLMCYDFAAENLETLRLLNYALINEFKARGINPFKDITDA